MKSLQRSAVLGLAILTACAGPQAPAPSATSNAPPPAAVNTPPPAKPAVESVTVDFDHGSVALSAAALEQMDAAARLYRDAHPEVMIVTGHTDKTGEEFPNVILSARRAEAVKKALADRGVPAERLQIVADGEAEPVPGILPSRTAVLSWR